MSRLSFVVVLLLASCAAPAPAELSPEDQELLRPYGAPTDSIQAKVDRGDARFKEAVTAQKQGDKAEALRLYQSARSSYLEAQAETGRSVSPLMKRVNECVKRIADLQRR